MQTDLISAIRRELEQQVDEKTRNSAQSLFKERVTFYGVKTPIVNKIAHKYFLEIKHLSKQEIFHLCEELLKSDYIEEAFIAFDWAYQLHDQYKPGDFIILENWLNKYVNNWAKCDTLCNHTIAAFIERYPQYLKNLKQWAQLGNRWLRRASAATLIIPAKQGKFLQDIFAIADILRLLRKRCRNHPVNGLGVFPSFPIPPGLRDKGVEREFLSTLILLQDKDDMVQKGYGWMLKAASQAHQKEVFEYVMRNKEIMPRTAFRYAIEKMPEDLRRLAMGKQRGLTI